MITVRIVLDTDTGVDDALAILFLATQDVDLLAVGSVHGNAPARQTAVNASQVLHLAGLAHVPVAVGAHTPLAQPLHTAEFIHGPDGLGGFADPDHLANLADVSAAEQLVRLARTHPGDITLIALGPLTNVALATMLEPDLPHLLRSVTVMGGALAVPGNITPCADANTWHDPEASDLVLGAGFDLTLVGLDVTENVRADNDWLARLAAIDTPQARFARDILGFYTDAYTALLGFQACTLHDPAAAAIALDPTLATYQTLPIAVELTGTHTRGRTVGDLRQFTPDPRIAGAGDPTRSPIRVAMTVDAPAILKRVIDSLDRP